MEYAHGGELYQKVHQDGRLAERLASFYFAQIVSAIDHLVCFQLILNFCDLIPNEFFSLAFS